MRDWYDCIVLGDGPAAGLVAGLVAAAGHSVLLERGPQSLRFPADCFLLPRSARTLHALARLGWEPSLARALAEREVTLDPWQATSALQQPESYWLFDRQRFVSTCLGLAQSIGLEIAQSPSQAAGRVLVETFRHPPPYPPVRPRPKTADLVLGGYYRNVCRATAWPGSCSLVKEGREGSRFWMVPVTAELTCLGVFLRNVPLVRTRGTANLWEDELVRCPALVERLLEAELVGELMTIIDQPPAGPPESTSGVPLIRLPEPYFPIPTLAGGPGVERAIAAAELAIQYLNPSQRRTDGPDGLPGVHGPLVHSQENA